jgi:hypothetical protein
VISNIVVSGAVPMLLVLGARRRGELRPRSTIGVLGGMRAVAGLTALYAGLLVAFAVVLFDTPAERVAAGVAALVLAGVVWQTIRDGAFRRRAIIAVGPGEDDAPAECRVTVAGEPADFELRAWGDRGEGLTWGTAVTLPPVGRLGGVAIRPLSLPAAADLELWIDPALPADVLPAALSLTLETGGEALRREVGRGATVLPDAGRRWTMRLETAAAPVPVDG